MQEKGGFSATCWLGNEGMLYGEVTAEGGSGGLTWQQLLGAPLVLGCFQGKKKTFCYFLKLKKLEGRTRQQNEHKAEVMIGEYQGRRWRIRGDHNCQREF